MQAYYTISFLQELIDVLECEGWIESWLCVMALEEFIEDRCKVRHSCVGKLAFIGKADSARARLQSDRDQFRASTAWRLKVLSLAFPDSSLTSRYFFLVA